MYALMPLGDVLPTHRIKFSAELEITVQLLVQIDKLVQLIESPIFTCKSLGSMQCIVTYRSFG